MKIYLDIDGTLIHEDLTENYGKPAAGLEEFLIALRPFDTYWLTTHCKENDPSHARKKLKEVVSEEYWEDIDRIKPTHWGTLKTDALDWDSEFIWFDNDILEEERARFAGTPDTQSFIEVNLRENPNQLIEITRDILNG